MKPQDLALSIRDILALLAPGLVLLLLLPFDVIAWIAVRAQLPGAKAPDAALFILMFLIVALVAGALLSGVAGLGDGIVDRWIEASNGQRWAPARFRARSRELARTRRLAQQLEALAIPAMPRDADLRPWGAKAFWWTYLRLHCPAAIAELDRVEGLQKQFRSLTLVGLIVGAASVTAAPQGRLLPAVLALAAAALCWWIYVGLRQSFAIRLFQLAVIHAVPTAGMDRASAILSADSEFWRGLDGKAS